MRQLYTPAGIDAQKVHNDIGGDAVVHNHAAEDKCGSFKHTLYRDGKKVDEWGVIDGSSNPPNVQGQ